MTHINIPCSNNHHQQDYMCLCHPKTMKTTGLKMIQHDECLDLGAEMVKLSVAVVMNKRSKQKAATSKVLLNHKVTWPPPTADSAALWQKWMSPPSIWSSKTVYCNSEKLKSFTVGCHLTVCHYDSCHLGSAAKSGHICMKGGAVEHCYISVFNDQFSELEDILWCLHPT